MTLLLAETQIRSELLTFAEAGDWEEFNSLLPFLADILQERGDKEEFWARRKWSTAFPISGVRSSDFNYVYLFSTPPFSPLGFTEYYELNRGLILCFRAGTLCWDSAFVIDGGPHLFWKNQGGDPWQGLGESHRLESFFIPENL